MKCNWYILLGALVFLLMALSTDRTNAETGSARASNGVGPSQFPVALVDQFNSPIKASRLLGKPAIVHFGFTHCPVVCPTTLNDIATLMQELGATADSANFIFVTVDPERDRPELLRDYISSFDNRIIGLTGPVESIMALAKDFKTTFAKRSNEDGEGYNMDHAVFAYLKDRNWKTVGTLYMGQGANKMMIKDRIRRLIAN